MQNDLLMVVVALLALGEHLAYLYKLIRHFFSSIHVKSKFTLEVSYQSANSRQRKNRVRPRRNSGS